MKFNNAESLPFKLLPPISENIQVSIIFDWREEKKYNCLFFSFLFLFFFLFHSQLQIKETREWKLVWRTDNDDTIKCTAHQLLLGVNEEGGKRKKKCTRQWFPVHKWRLTAVNFRPQFTESCFYSHSKFIFSINSISNLQMKIESIKLNSCFFISCQLCECIWFAIFKLKSYQRMPSSR